jgi:hypothetical protein|tara:strand:+ start:371 stop:571 length:201 start_codon:yes stop_codon:yes gene_type:complete
MFCSTPTRTILPGVQAVDEMADPNYKPPKIPKPAAARARIYKGIAKNELLSQCALAALASRPVESK